MKANNNYNSHNATFSSKISMKLQDSKQEQPSVLNVKKKFTKSPLSNFLIWLKEQIDAGNKQLSLNTQSLILYKPSSCSQDLIFLLPEVIEQYHIQTGIAAEIIKFELKNALEITFAYTIIKNEKVIEVFPCKKFF
ncbi:hypothetical protein [Legionella gresilensis]|uniref:hypothetical protein n=1 Tax=Legionella gresilensis TaxID=91823 RepID=UPI0010415EAB|nr:hypothetical protein [Legionella gresilensis]